MSKDERMKTFFDTLIGDLHIKGVDMAKSVQNPTGARMVGVRDIRIVIAGLDLLIKKHAKAVEKAVTVGDFKKAALGYVTTTYVRELMKELADDAPYHVEGEGCAVHGIDGEGKKEAPENGPNPYV
jgi:hypothetical protein